MTFGIAQFLVLVLVIGPAIMLAPIVVNAIIQRREDMRFYRAEYLRLSVENARLQRRVADLTPPF